MNTLQKILLISDGFFILSGSLIGPIYALFVEKIGGDLLDASSTYALFMLTAGVVTFLLARWEDKSKHKRKFVVLGYGLAFVGSVGYLFVSSTTSLFIVQIVLGLAVALKDPAYDALFSTGNRKHLALTWGEWETVDYFAIGIGALAGGIIAQYLGFQALLISMVVLAFFSLAISLKLLQFKKL